MRETPGGAATDWFDWHAQYDDASSPLAQRLLAVQRRIAEALDGSPSGPLQVVSMCAGQGRDLLGVLVNHPRRGDVRARLVEADPRNAGLASTAAGAIGIDQIDAVVGDASFTTAYQGVVPADLVLACGVFGHATDNDVRRIIDHLSMLCAPGATVIWTRGGHEPDLRPSIRRWFTGAGFDEVGFDTGGAAGWGVGAHRLVGEPRPYEAGIRLFTFIDHLPHRNR